MSSSGWRGATLLAVVTADMNWCWWVAQLHSFLVVFLQYVLWSDLHYQTCVYLQPTQLFSIQKYAQQHIIKSQPIRSFWSSCLFMTSSCSQLTGWMVNSCKHHLRHLLDCISSRKKSYLQPIAAQIQVFIGGSTWWHAGGYWSHLRWPWQ